MSHSQGYAATRRLSVGNSHWFSTDVRRQLLAADSGFIVTRHMRSNAATLWWHRHMCPQRIVDKRSAPANAARIHTAALLARCRHWKATHRAQFLVIAAAATEITMPLCPVASRRPCDLDGRRRSQRTSDVAHWRPRDNESWTAVASNAVDSPAWNERRVVKSLRVRSDENRRKKTKKEDKVHVHLQYHSCLCDNAHLANSRVISRINSRIGDEFADNGRQSDAEASTVAIVVHNFRQHGE